MKFVNYYTNSVCNNSNVSLGFFTRQKGFSKNNFSSLNCSYSSGDKEIDVSQNIKKAFKTIVPVKTKQLKLINQIHSRNVFLVNKTNILEKFSGDGIITKDRDISIAVLTADCCPIFLYDDDSSFISCLHAGWKGCYLNIIENALDQIKAIQNSTKKINAIIGPCLQSKYFEVNKDFKDKFLLINIQYEKFFSSAKKINKYLFDMRGLIEFQLKINDIKNIEHIDIDTYSNEELFFSHRRSGHLNNLPTGRMINIISFNN
jgi:YfiH family protein